VVETHEQAVKTCQFGKFGVGERDTLPHSGGAQPFALEQGLEDLPFGQPRKPRRPLGDFLQRLLFAGRLQSGDDAVR